MARSPMAVALATRAFALLVRLLPAPMRADTGPDTVALFEAIAQDAWRDGGTLGVARTWLGAAADLFRRAPAEHLRARRSAGVSPIRPPSDSPTSHLAMNLSVDLRHAFRSLRQSPATSLVIVLTLGLGIGAVVTVFTVVNAVLLRPLGYPEPERLHVLVDVRHGETGGPISYLDALDVRDRLSAIESLAVYDEWRANVTGVDEPERIDGALVTSSFFDVLGVRAQLGRFFVRDEDIDGNDRVVVLSHRLWVRKFGADPAIVGRRLLLNGREHEVIGVAPDFEDPLLSGASWEAPLIWRPLGYDGLPEGDVPGRGGHSYIAIARLREGVSPDAAQAELDALMAALASEHPESNTDKGMRMQPLHDVMVGPARASLWLLMGAVSFLLSIAVANVAALTLSRSVDRARETALRAALGAGRARLGTLFLCEGAVLAAAGAALGIGFAVLLRNALLVLGGPFMPRQIALDWRVASFAIAVTAAVALCAALAPLVRASRMDLHAAMSTAGKGVGGGRSLGRRVLVGVEVALALMLLAGAGLLGRSLWNLYRIDPGLDPSGLLVFELSLPSSGYGEEGAANRFFSALLDQLGSAAGVEGAATINFVPLSGNFDCTTGWRADRPKPAESDRVCPQIRTVSPSYADVAGVAVTAGRFLSDLDRADSEPVAVVSRALAELFWPGEDPIGQQVAMGERPTVTIVGIAEDVVHTALREPPPPAMYFTHAQNVINWHEMRATVLVRAGGSPLAVAGTVRDAVRRLDPQLPIAGLRTMDDVVAASVAQERMRALLIGIFATSALLLAALGVYGVIAYAVSRERRDVAIRVALGADAGRVVRHMLGVGLLPVAAGTAVGLAGAVVLGRWLQGMLFEVGALDPLALGGVPLLLLAIAALAAWVPARRANRVDPAEALRAE